MLVAEARGAILVTAKNHGLEVTEFTPNDITSIDVTPEVQISSATVSGGPWNSTDYFAVRPTSLLSLIHI